MAAKIYKFRPKKSSGFMQREDIYLSTGTDARPVFVKMDGWWVLFDYANEEHLLKMKEVEGKVIPLTGNKK